jgi:methyl-accepting chemotaxis protein
MRSLPTRKPFFSSIGSKVLLGLLVAALLPLVASILISLTQMNRLSGQARSTSSDALTSNAQQALQTQVGNLATTIGQHMQLIANTTQELANYAGYLIDNPDLFSNGAYPQTIFQDPKGQWYNPKTDPASAFVPNKVPRLTPALRQMLNTLTFLDPVFKAHYDQDQYPTYFGATDYITRYYPNIDLAHVVPPNFDVTQRPWFIAANPKNDPKRVPVLSQLYDDATGKGLTITSSAPVYTQDGTFVGVIGRDVTLQTILSTILPSKVGQNGYAFLVGQDSNIISMPGTGQADFGVQLKAKTGEVLLNVPLDAQKEPAITAFTHELANSNSGIDRLSLKGNPKYLAFEQVQGTPWDIVLVLPESEVLAPVATLNTQLNQQISRTQLLSLGLTLGLIFLAGIIAYFLSHNIARPILAITNSAQYLAAGQSIYQNQEIGAQQERMVQRRDEVGELARAFEAIDRYFEETSQLADQIAQGNLGIQVHRISDQDRLGLALENMMSYLNQILQVATTLASGDLSQEIQPRSPTDVLGNALKYMLDELRALVMRVQAAAREIEAASAFVLQRSAFLVEASERQMEQITNATGSAGQMAESNHRVAEDTYTLARVAYSARGHAQTGYQAIQQTITGMNQIQEDVRLATQRVGQLTRRSQEITHVVEIISSIAHQTNRLALDAAIHASAAGPYSRNFNIIATNIRNLADQVKEEANQISHLIQTIVEETNQAIQATKQSQQRVAEGMNLASSAGTALEAISNVVDQQSQLVEVISQVAKQQRDTSMAVAQEMQSASDITTQYSAGTRQTAQSIERLAYLARQLKESVEAFTLPGSYNNPEASQQLSQVNGMQMRPPVRSARPMPLLPQGSSTRFDGMNGV